MSQATSADRICTICHRERCHSATCGEYAGILSPASQAARRAELAKPRFHCGRCFGWSPGATCQWCGHATDPSGKNATPCKGEPCACGSRDLSAYGVTVIVIPSCVTTTGEAVEDWRAA